MSWIKRNLIWLVGLLFFALIVLGSLLLLKNQIAEREKVAIELETEIKELERLTTRSNFPDPGNVKDMEQDNQQMDQRINQLLKQFAKAQVPTQIITGIKFREMMNKRTQDLARLARQQGVTIPQDDLFGFKRYDSTIPDNENVPLLIKQLNVTEEISTTLLKSPRVLQLLKITRVEFEDAAAGTGAQRSDAVVDMPNGFKGIQNDSTKMYTVMPFMIDFTADPEGLRNLLNNLMRSKYLLIPAYINIKADELEVTGKVKKQQVTPEGKVITPLPEEAEVAAETTKYVLGQRGLGISMRLDWIEFRQEEPKEKRGPKRDKKAGGAAAPASESAQPMAPAGQPSAPPNPAGATPAPAPTPAGDNPS